MLFMVRLMMMRYLCGCCSSSLKLFMWFLFCWCCFWKVWVLGRLDCMMSVMMVSNVLMKKGMC